MRKNIYLSLLSFNFVLVNRFSDVGKANLSNASFNITYKKTSVSAFLGDLTEEKSDAIVNAANSDLLHGGGVAGAIRVKGGNSIQAESNAYVRKHGRVETGQVAMTGAGNLKCKFIIHAVGPIWKGGDYNEEELLKSCLMNSLRKANENSLNSISIPAISTGIYGFPKDLAAKIFARAIYDYLLNEKTTLQEIRLIDRSDTTVNLWTQELKEKFKQ